MIPNRAIAGRIAALLLFVLAATVGLLRGGVSLYAQVLACAGAALALGLAALADRRGRTPRLPLCALLPLLVFGVAVLQCVPIPAFLLGWLAPVNAQLRFMPPAPARMFAPVTLDLPATASSLAPAFAIACGLMAAVLLARRARPQILLLAAPVAAALIQLAICLVRLAGQGAFGGSFVNRNHLAALLMLGALAAAGAALSPPREDEPGALPQLATTRPLWIASAIASAAGTLLTLSRGAAVGLGLGAAVLLVLEQRSLGRESRKGRVRSRRRYRGLWLALPLAAAVGCALLLSTTPLTARFSQMSGKPLSADVKLRSFLGAAFVALDHPLTGVGRGVWRFVSERHRSVSGEMAFIYVENEPLQLAAEEGLPVAFAFVLIAILCAWRAAKAARSGLSRGVVAGAVAVGLQNLVDFNLEFVGVALPLVVAFGAALADERLRSRAGINAHALPLEPGAAGAETSPAPASARRKPLEPPGWRRAPRMVLLAAGALGLLLAPLPLLLRHWDAEREAQRLVFEARDPATSADVLLADAEATVARHPTDWLISLAPAIGLHQRSPRRTAEALAWVGRAQVLGPKSWRPHVVAAAILLRAGRPGQARIESRLALDNLADFPATDPLEIAVRSSQTLDELLEASPDDPAQRARLSMQLRADHRPALARALVEEELALPDAARTEAATTALRLELAILLSEAHEDRGAEEVAAKLPRENCGRALLIAAARRAQGRTPAEIEQPLLEARPRCPLQVQIHDQLFHERLARKDLAGAAEVLDDPVLADSSLPFAAQAHTWRAELLEAKGERAQGLHERWLAALVSPEDPNRALDYASRLQAQGDVIGALVALRTLSLRATLEARTPIDARIAELEKLRAEQRLPPASFEGH